MSNERSITATFWNHTNVTLTNYSAVATAGGYPTPVGMLPPSSGASLPIKVEPGGYIRTFAQNNNGACNGVITLTDSASQVEFVIRYVLPSGSDKVLIRVEPPSDYPSCIGIADAPSYSGSDPAANLGLYVGLAVQEWNEYGEYTAGYAVPLLANPYAQNNARDMVNSMFQLNIRKPDGVQHWFDQAAVLPYQAADFSGNQLSLGRETPPLPLVQTMLNLWPGVVTSPVTTSPDYPLIQFLADFLVPSPASTSTPPLVMYVPEFSYQGYYNSGGVTGPIYQLTGYQAYPFAGTGGDRFDISNVQTFLQLFLGGAHFVNIQAYRDFQNINPKNPPPNTGRNLYTLFQDQFPDNNTMTGRHYCIGNSHYTNTVNTSGWYYGNQMGEWASSGCGLLLSLLVAKTADNQYNTFMQLEGWPADGDWWSTRSLSGGARHGQDYAAYNQSLWNISTFGAIPYSEKRGTTIFLAPPSWIPSIYSDTYMMPYVGAEKKQGWLKTQLVSVPSGTPSRPN